MKEIDLKRVVEECAEVIVAATKIMRFGLKGSYCDGTENVAALIQELGDLKACVELLEIPQELIDAAAERKREKLKRITPYELGFDCDLTREQRERLHGQ